MFLRKRDDCDRGESCEENHKILSHGITETDIMQPGGLDLGLGARRISPSPVPQCQEAKMPQKNRSGTRERGDISWAKVRATLLMKSTDEGEEQRSEVDTNSDGPAA